MSSSGMIGGYGRMLGPVRKGCGASVNEQSFQTAALVVHVQGQAQDVRVLVSQVLREILKGSWCCSPAAMPWWCRSVYGSIQSTFALPGIFHVMCLTVDIVVTVTSRIREVERREDEAAAAGAAAAPAAAPAAAGAAPAAPGPREGQGGAAPPATDAAAQRLGGGASGPGPRSFARC